MNVTCLSFTLAINATAAANSSTEACKPILERITILALLTFYRPMAAFIERYLTPLWYVVGFPGNLLAFLVWIQARMRPSSGCYLAALALNDFIFLMLHMCYELQNTWDIKTLYQPIWCEIFPILYISAQHLSPLLVLGFTVERYISICHPFQRERYCNTKRALIVIASLVCFTLTLNSIQGYFWTFVKGECSVRLEALKNGQSSLWSVWSWVTELLVFGVVPIVILILNILVLKELKRMTDREDTMMRMPQPSSAQGGRPQKGSSSAAQSATTLTLLVVSFYLIFATLPVTVCYAVFFTFPPGDQCATDEMLCSDDTWQNHLSYWYARIVIQELGMSHYVGNFYIYLLTGRLFRRELRMLFLRTFCKDSIRRWLGANSLELTELTTFHSKYVVTNGRLDKSANSIDKKP